MDEREKSDPLRELGERLDKARQAQGPKASGAEGEARQALGIGLRLGLELVVSVFVGAGLGWAFDDWLGTQPWGLVAFTLLGFASGVVMVFRAALGMERAVGFGPPPPPTEPPKGAGWDDDEE